MDQLLKIYGIGPELAKKYLKHGIGGVKINPKKPIRAQLKNKKILPHLTEATRADLKYYPSRRIPRAVIADIAAEFKKYLKGIRHSVAGSFRRKKPYSRDIDLIISAPSNKTTAKHWQNFLKRMKKSKKVKFFPAFAQGADKVSVILRYSGKRKINIKCDIFFTDPSEYMFMLLYATGSGQFNIRMRSVAKRRGYMLNQRGLFKKISPTILERVPIKNEKALFKKLNIRYLKPENRIK